MFFFLLSCSTAEHTQNACVLDMGSHTPPEDRQARLSGAGREYLRHRRNSRNPCVLFLPSCSTAEHTQNACVLDMGSHTPPEDRQARLSGAGREYLRHRRNSRNPCVLFLLSCSTAEHTQNSFKIFSKNHIPPH